MLLQAKFAIALKWRERQACTSGQWITELTSNLTLEKLTYMKLKKFYVFFSSINKEP